MESGTTDSALYQQLANRVHEEVHGDVENVLRLLEASVKRSVVTALGTLAQQVAADSTPRQATPGAASSNQIVDPQVLALRVHPNPTGDGRRAPFAEIAITDAHNEDTSEGIIDKGPPPQSEAQKETPSSANDKVLPEPAGGTHKRQRDDELVDDLTELRSKPTAASERFAGARKSRVRTFASKFKLRGDSLEKMLEKIERIETMQEPKRRGKAQSCTASGLFESTCMVVIILNALYIAGVEDHRNRHPAWRAGLAVQVCDIIFLAWYAFEIAIKLYVHRLFFFVGRELRWNYFDLFLVLFGFSDLITDMFSAKDAFNPLFIRGLRLIKLLKLLRTVRVLKVFRDLRLMILGLMGSVLSLIWCIVMLMFCLYMFGLVFLQGTATYFSENRALIEEPGVDSVHKHMLLNWTGLDRTLLTLYMAVTGGVDWKETYDSLQPLGWLYQLIFLFFTIFFTFALMNTVTAVYVENMAKNGQPDEKMLLDDWRRIRRMEAETVSQLLDEMDLDHSGSITLQEFQLMSQTDWMIALFKHLGIEVDDAEMLFRLLTNFSPESEEVDRDTFLNGLLRIKGRASAVDLHVLSFQIKLAHRATRNLKDQILPVLDELTDTIGVIKQEHTNLQQQKQARVFMRDPTHEPRGPDMRKPSLYKPEVKLVSSLPISDEEPSVFGRVCSTCTNP